MSPIYKLDAVANRILSDMLRGNSLDMGPFHEPALGAPDDLVGYEFPSLNYAPYTVQRSPLMADVPGADTSNWSSEARPSVTAWEGADMDAYWLDNGTWRHCRTGEAWAGEPVNLLDAVQAHRSMSASQAVIADLICAAVCASIPAREGSEQMEAV